MNRQDPFEDVRNRISEEAEKFFNEQMTSTLAGTIERQGNQSLRLQDIFDCQKRLDRFDKVYFIECKFLPDDCYGIMYVRPEDMPKNRDADNDQGNPE